MSDTGEKNNIRFLKRLALSSLLFLAAIAGIVILFDPFYHYHAPLGNMKAVLQDRDWQVAGTLDHFSYDSIVLGNSLVENTNTHWIEELYGNQAVKAIRAGGSNAELCFYMDRAFEAQKLERVFYCIDKSILCADPSATLDGFDYSFLLDRNPLNDGKYLWNKDVLLKKIPLQLACNTVLDYDEGEAYDWYRTKTFSAEAMIIHYEPAESFEEMQPVEELLKYLPENLRMLKERIKAHPETEFVLFFPPSSLLWWDQELRGGELEADRELLRRLSTAFSDCDNVKLYAFFAEETYCELDNYMDVSHFSPEVNRKLFEDMAAGRCLMTKENTEEGIARMDERIRRFSSEEIRDYYPEAVLLPDPSPAP